MSQAAVLSLPSRALGRARALGPYAAVWGAVACWAACALFVRAAHADAVRYTTVRLWLSVPPLFAIGAWRLRRSTVAPASTLPGRGRVALLGALAVAGVLFAAGASTAFAAIGMTTLLDATLIPALQPVVVILIAVTFLHERVRASLVARCGLAVAGTAIVASAASGSGTWSLAGDLMAVASLFANSLWHVYGRFIRHRFGIDPLVFMTGALTFAAIVMTPIALVATGGLSLGAHAFGYAAATMVVGTTAHVLMVWAHRYVPASQSAPVLLGEPPIVALAGWVAFGEAPNALEFAGSAIVVAALVGVARSDVEPDLTAEMEEPTL